MLSENFLKSFKNWVKDMKEGAGISMREFVIKKPEDGYEVKGKKIVATADGILSNILKNSPFFAGWSSVVVVHSDMVACGALPLNLFISVSAKNKEHLRKILKGIKSASSLLDVPVSGGHTILGAHPSLSAFLIGEKKTHTKKFREKNLIIGLLYDRKGKKGTDLFPSWNSFFRSTTYEIKRKREGVLEILKYASFVKDISSGGILGTSAIALESMELGGEIEVKRISPPMGLEVEYWLKAFHSFGFLVFTKEQLVDIIRKKVEECGLRFDVIGRTFKGNRFYILHNSRRMEFFDFSRESILKWR